MEREKFEKYKTVLLDMRRRVQEEMQHVAEAIRQDANPETTLSRVPLHLADMASEASVADVHVLETEQGLLEQIEAALNRLGDGTFGTCQECGSPIDEERVEAVPYAPYCIDCARNSTERTPTGTPYLR